jgi:hypothetical protein
MNHLVSSFSKYLGMRGVHAYDGTECRFLAWGEVISFLKRLPEHSDPQFSEKLLDTLSNYDPDTQFLAIHQDGETVSIELYSRAL